MPLARPGLFGKIQVVLFASVLLLGALPSAASSRNTPSAKAELAGSADFRVRVGAALYLGKAKDGESHRSALEMALNDAHPSVRTAVAAALGSRGEPDAIPSLERRLSIETVPIVKTQLRSSIVSLQATSPGQRFVVQLGQMRSQASGRGEQLGQVMRTAAIRSAAGLPGAVVVADPNVLKGASKARLPLLVLDASLIRLTPMAGQGGAIAYNAKVDFAVRKLPGNTLKASLSGSAISMSSVDRSPASTAALQDQAVAGAVESALRNIGHSLERIAQSN